MKDHKILKAFVLGLLGLFIIHQLYSSLYKPIVTEAAQYYETEDGIKTTGTVVRNEVLVNGSAEGVMHYVSGDGAHVAKGGIIALVYDSAATSYTVSQIDELNRKIANIEQLQAYNSVSAADLSVADAKVDEALNSMITSARGGNLTDSEASSEKLLTMMCRRQMITGEQTDFTPQLEALKAEAASLSASLPAASGSVAAPTSGYFLSCVDGYEAMLSGRTAAELTPEFLNQVKAEPIAAGTIGKIVSDYEWYVACNLTVNQSLKYKEGDELTLVTNAGGKVELKATVKSINISAGGDDAVLVLSCSSLSKELASMRKGNFTIVSKSYQGLRIPKKSLRIVNKQSGVYVLSGVTVKFVPVKVLYTMDDYIICKQEKELGNVLHLYDEVVVKGKKLYDGKVVG